MSKTAEEYNAEIQTISEMLSATRINDKERLLNIGLMLLNMTRVQTAEKAPDTVKTFSMEVVAQAFADGGENALKDLEGDAQYADQYDYLLKKGY